MTSAPPTPATAPPVREIIAKGPSALDAVKGTAAWPFGKFWSFSEKEHVRLTATRDRVAKYLAFIKPKRPLCIAVFGPPGSGKSTARQADL